jgi:hypothetical protein
VSTIIHRNKYQRDIRNQFGVLTVDVYDVLKTFGVTCPARAHAIKKLLAAGQRGSKSEADDCKEALEAIARSIEMIDQKRKDG